MTQRMNKSNEPKSDSFLPKLIIAISNFTPAFLMRHKLTWLIRVNIKVNLRQPTFERINKASKYIFTKYLLRDLYLSNRDL